MRAPVGARAAGLAVEHDDRRAVIVHAGTIGPQVGVARLATARIELAHWRFMGMQAIVLAQQFARPVSQRLQGHADAPDPVGQGRTGQWRPLARCDLLDPVQRQVVEILAGGDPGQQAHRGHASIDDGSRDRRCCHRLAGRDICARACRLVQCAGAGEPYGRNINSDEIEHEISFHLAEGLIVEWLFETPLLYICTQEPACPVPPWDKVKAEDALIDVEVLLRDAGSGG